MGVNDLYHILFTHWVYDDASYTDDRQRVEVATALLHWVRTLFSIRVVYHLTNNQQAV